MSATKSDKMAALTSSLTSSDVELWLDDNVDWLCDYLQRRHFTAHSIVPTQCRGTESTPSPRHSQTQTTGGSEHVNVTSSTPRPTSPMSHHHHHRQQQQQQQPLVQRGVTMPDYAVPMGSNLFIVTSEGSGRRASSAPLFPTLDATQTQNSKRHLRRHFARSRMRTTKEPLAAISTETTTSASFDWLVVSLSKKMFRAT